MMLEKNLFGNVLMSLRVRRGKLWTQERTAELLGISRRTYAKWEDEDEGHIPSPEYLKKIAAVFDLSEVERDTLYLAAARTPPKICHLPFPRNPFFTGRKTHLEQLERLLQESDTAAITQAISISGLGGIGKTQLALEYAHRSHPKVYRAVFWVNAADETTLQVSYDSLAQILDLPERNERELAKRVQAVKRWLEVHTGWLLIMDNADDLQLARSFFPVKHQGHILLTTRSQIAGNVVANQIGIEQMEPEEGLLFLLRRSGVLDDDNKLDTVDADTRETALQLVKLLGGHPLALDQAGAYIEGSGVSFIDYMDLYLIQRRLFLSKYGATEDEQSEHHEYSEHPDTVATTFDICFKQARGHHPLADDILRFCAFLAPDDIPVELFQHDDSFKLDTNAFNNGIAALQRYSLIKHNRHEQVFSLHRLVQAVLIDAMPPDIQKQWRERVVRALNVTFPEPEEFNWSQCERLVSHASFCVTWIDDELSPTVVTEAVTLLLKAASYLSSQKQLSLAEMLLVVTLSFCQQRIGVEHPFLSLVLLPLAGVYSALGKYEQAEFLYLRAITILETYHGVEHPGTLGALADLAYLYLQQGKFEQAEIWLQRLIAMQENQLGVEHPDIAKSLTYLGCVYNDQGKFEQAESSCLRALKILVAHLETAHHGVESPYFVYLFYWLLMLLSKPGVNVQTEAFCQHAFNILQQRLESTHPDDQPLKRANADALAMIRHGAELVTPEAYDESSD